MKFYLLALTAIISGMIISPFLAVGIGLLTMVSSFIGFWRGLILSMRVLEQHINHPKNTEEKGVWEKHQEKLDEANKD